MTNATYITRLYNITPLYYYQSNIADSFQTDVWQSAVASRDPPIKVCSAAAALDANGYTIVYRTTGKKTAN